MARIYSICNQKLFNAALVIIDMIVNGLKHDYLIRGLHINMVWEPRSLQFYPNWAVTDLSECLEQIYSPLK